MQRLRERAVVRAYRAASAGLARLSPRVSLPVAHAVFVASAYAWPAKRRIILDNASHVLRRPPTDPAVALLARRIFGSYSRFVIELMRLPGRPDDEPSRIMVDLPERGGSSFVALHGRLAAEGRGTLAVTGHIGSIDVLAGAFAARGLRTFGVADDSAYPELFELLNQQRRRWGITVVPWRNMREIYRALRARGVVGLVVDWGYRSTDVPVQLFGSWTTLPAGPAVLAARTGAAVVPVVCRRRPDGRYEASHYDPFLVSDSSPAAIQAATQRIATVLEQIIGQAPDQWYSFKPIWPRTAHEEDALRRRAEAMRADTGSRRGTPAADGEATGDASVRSRAASEARTRATGA